jgi:predicted adenylyl cyclase CyaB
MLGYLEFQKEAEVKKTRSIWKLGKYTICLDLVENLGEYIEIEYILPQNHNFEKELNQMKSFITRLKINIDDQILEGYLDLLLK